jgi:outer membrane protein assembly factor BamB
VPVDTHEGNADWVSELPFQQVIIGAAITENRSPNILVVSQRQYLYSLDAQTGDLLAQTATIPNDEWQFNHRTPQPVIWGNYVIHISDSTVLVAYDLDNLNEEWRYDLRMRTVSSPIISGNAMFISTLAGTVYAFCSEQ